ncbi:MAG: RdgB/HAM1 family non-canonical purine NTP pyrophosphatase [Sporichthyaceae bacterium]
MTQLVLATRNAGKLAELQRLLDDAGLAVTLRSVGEFSEVGEVAETGVTFAENAALKARAVAAATGLPAVADDSGLCVDALNAMPGIFSARWSGRHGDDEANLDLVLAQIADVPEDRRGAAFVCAGVLALPDGAVETVEGEIRGRLLRERVGTNGFGYDPIFVPDGHHRTTAQMSAAEKDAISHRGQAMRALVPIIARVVRT